MSNEAVDYKDLILAGKDSTKVNEIQIIADQINELKEQKKAFEEAIDALNDQLTGLCAELELEKVAFPQYTISYNTTTTRTISADALKHVLLANSIPVNTITTILDAATKVTVSPPKARIYPRKSKE